MAKNSKKPESDIADVERLTFEAMRHCGMIPPMTISDVEKLEERLESIELPFGPRNPFELLQNRKASDEQVVRPVAPVKTAEQDGSRNRAMAARKGGEISDEIERRMAEDKLRHLQNGNG